MHTFFLAMLIGQPYPVALADFPKVAPDYPVAQSAQPVTYEAAHDAALATRAPLVVFIGTPSRSVQGSQSVRVEALPGYPAKCVVVALPGTGVMNWRATLPETSTDAQIRRAAGLEQPAASPFESSASRDLPTVQRDARDDEPPVGGLTFLRGLEPYTSATRTQLSFRRWSGWLGSTPRSGLEERWRVPGGLVGVQGWTSQLYRRATSREFLVRQDPDDSNSAVTWSRSYDDGAVFADVLRNRKGKVFEIRTAEKRDGQWDRYVAFTDAAERPAGYNRLKSADCRACHEGPPGRSDYGGAAVPGADTIFSDPISAVESGQVVQGGYGTMGAR